MNNRYYNHFQDIAVYDISMKMNARTSYIVPLIEKIVLNIGVLSVVGDKRQILPALLSLELITGQRAQVTVCKKPSLDLKIRKGVFTGCKVVLRKRPMYNFFDKFLTLTVPRIPHFTGFKRKLVTDRGNLTFRVHDPLAFFELEYEYLRFRDLPPIDITIVTTGTTREEGVAVLSALQFPFIPETDSQ